MPIPYTKLIFISSEFFVRCVNFVGEDIYDSPALLFLFKMFCPLLYGGYQCRQVVVTADYGAHFCVSHGNALQTNHMARAPFKCWFNLVLSIENHKKGLVSYHYTQVK